jgi:transposase-like protein
LGNVISIDDERIKNHLDRVVRGTVEETLNALLEAEADRLCNAQRYERSAGRRDTRAGHYERNLQTKAGEVRLRVPKLPQQTFETAIIERYRRRESSVEEALIEMYLAGVSVRRVEGITEALWGTRVSPSTVSDAAWQRCVVHWYRNIFSHLPSTKVREIAAMLKAIHAREDIVAAREKVIRVIEKLRGLRLARAAELVETAVEETLTYTNPLIG